jgi:hypothetical protein
MTEKTEMLRQFFGGYFNQDWDIVGSTSADVLHAYFRDEQSTSALLQLVEALRDLLQAIPEDRELESYLSKQLWCDYMPNSVSTRRWLEDVVVAMQEEVRRRSR